VAPNGCPGVGQGSLADGLKQLWEVVDLSNILYNLKNINIGASPNRYLNGLFE
jgi:hypothetical protein